MCSLAAPPAVEPALRALRTAEGTPRVFAGLHRSLLSWHDAGDNRADVVLRQAHGTLASAELLSPKALRETVATYIGGHTLCEEVLDAVVALDAHLLGDAGVLLEDLPTDVWEQFCQHPGVLVDKESTRAIQQRLYGTSQYPIPLSVPMTPSAAEGPQQQQEPEATTRRRQLVVERETHMAAVREYQALQLQMSKEGRAAGERNKARVWTRWVEVLAKRITAIREKPPLKGNGMHGKRLLGQVELSPELLSVITCHTVLNLVYLPCFRHRSDMKDWKDSVPFVTVVVAVGKAVEVEMQVRQFKKPKRVRMECLIRGRGSEWDLAKETVPVGSALVDLLLANAFVEVEPAQGEGRGSKALMKAFSHYTLRENRRVVGYLRLEACARAQMDRSGGDLMRFITPKHQPMIMRPLRWRPAAMEGGFLLHKVPFIRTRDQRSTCLQVYSPDRVSRVMDQLGSLPWRVNRRIMDVMLEADRRGLTVAEIPPKKAPEVPRIPLNAAQLPPEERTQLLVRRHNAEKKAMELLSSRPTFELKIGVAQNFQHAERLYFPHNVDFRGRAYPVPPHLNHISDDICRGLLMFAEPRALGEEGLEWLKISLANLMGKNKASFEERIAYVDESKPWIMDVAQDPLAPHNVERWANADDGPWQALARCLELADVWRSGGDARNFMSYLPVHMDGSCNGLQHYAALGRDEMGAQAVNLTPSERPQDVYSVVLGFVKKKVEEDAKRPEGASKEARDGGLARRLIELGVLQRKVVKQTIMTICYGVTNLGAKQQVQSHLEDAVGQHVASDELSRLALYLSGKVLRSIDEVFKQAMQIKGWFDSISAMFNERGVPTSWLSPIGLVCVQPYDKRKVVQVRSALQSVSLMTSSRLGIKKSKHRMGFPPNFIHSLDATHMMMVASGCHAEGIAFAGVHDSFWTHACDVPKMNEIIRSAFVELHSQPILEELYEDVCVRLGGITPPPLPRQGSLDITRVKDSRYIFA